MVLALPRGSKAPRRRVASRIPHEANVLYPIKFFAGAMEGGIKAAGGMAAQPALHLLPGLDTC